MEVEAEAVDKISAKECAHCFEEIIIPIKDDEGHSFCCSGCKTVFHILQDSGLDGEYYNLKKSSPFFSKPATGQESSEEYRYLDDQVFIDEYAKEEKETLTMEFYLEGVHCLACLWLIEKLPLLIEDVLVTRLNLNKSVVAVKIKKGGKFSMAAKKLSQLGYRPHPILKGSQAEELRIKEDRKMLIKIGVAAAATMNIMLYAISIYAGASGFYAKSFAWISLAFTIPVVFFSSIPFYQSAWSSLKNKTVNIDVPIAFAILLGFTSGAYNTFSGSEVNYFDSITMLVFLLLFSRYALRVAQQKSLQTASFSQFFSSGTIHRKNNETNSFEDIHERYLNVDDVIKVESGETIPADGVIIDGSSSINTSTLTGESIPTKAIVGNNVFSGTVNIDLPLIIRVKAIHGDTRIGKILKQVEDGWQNKAPIVRFADKVARYLVSFILGLAALTFFYFALTSGFETAFNRSLALIIVTCPCALGLATPLAFTRSLSRATQLGMIIKSEDVLERLTKQKNIFLDKTGTLTFGQYKVINWSPLQNNDEDIPSLIFSLESKSRHPLAKSLVEYILTEFPQSNLLDMENYTEILGKGVSGDFSGNNYKVMGLSGEQGVNSVGLYKNGEKIFHADLQDRLRPTSKEFIQQLRDMKMNPSILSGDNLPNVSKIAHEVGLTEGEFISGASPEEKNKIVKDSSQSIMVGDGANDALALTNAGVGIAVHGSVDISLRAADVYLARPGVGSVIDLILLARETMKIIYRNLGFSLIYNITGAALSIAGIITPLWAAILMPLSSLTVIMSTLMGTGTIRKKLNKKVYS